MHSNTRFWSWIHTKRKSLSDCVIFQPIYLKVVKLSCKVTSPQSSPFLQSLAFLGFSAHPLPRRVHHFFSLCQSLCQSTQQHLLKVSFNKVYSLRNQSEMQKDSDVGFLDKINIIIHKESDYWSTNPIRTLQIHSGQFYSIIILFKIILRWL